MELFLEDCHNKSVAILGDICLDLYYFISDENIEISLETKLPTYPVKSSKFELGGAANVAVNCKRLGIENVDIYGLVGNDYYGTIIRDLFKKENINTNSLLIEKNNFSSNVYHKVYKDGKELPRYDFGNFNSPSKQIQDQVIEHLEKNINKYDVIIINEQVLSGIHNSYFEKQLNTLIDNHQEKKWISDCRTRNNVYKKTIHKLNNHEGYNLVKKIANNFSNIKNTINDHFIANYLYNYWKLPLIMTCGENGALVANENGLHDIMGLHIIQHLDTVGAGDAFLSGLTFGLCCGYTLTKAATVGNFSASVSCQILFETGHPTLSQIQELANQADYRYNYELASDIRLANYYENTDIEIINKNVINSFSVYPKVCIFDHDGTISVLREGWEEIMLETMIEVIAGEKYNSLSKEDLKKITDQSKSLIEKTTGVQTIIQMQELVKLIDLNNYVKKEDILDAWDYKKIYNDKLLKKVAKRREKLANEQLNIDDVTIKGAVNSLIKLRNANTKTYLASGTDVEDVIEEAKALGYAQFFTGGINGSEGDVSLDPKRKVIQNLISDIENKNEIKINECVVFGDGPVEMREAKKHGLIAIGILSDETRRWGKNLSKRERLILAGADILIDDFSSFSKLSKLLGWE